MKITLFRSLVLFFISNAIALQAQQSTLVYPGTDGKLIYTPHANNGETNNVNILPDFSHVGYMNGGVKVPVGEVPVKNTLYPTASGQDRTRIQAAIDQVCAMTPDANGFRGAVLLKKGTYRLNDGTITNLNDGYGYALRIWASGVVLRGEGQGTNGTVLYSDFAVNHTMITLEPQSKGASETNIQLITDEYVGTGANSFTVASTSGYAVGDWIMVRFTPNDTWFSDLKVTTGGFINDPADYWTVTGEREAYRIGFKRKITAINGNNVTVDCPLVQPLQTKYGGGQIAKLTSSGRLSKCGVEDLRIVGIEDGGSPSVSGNGNRLRAGIRPRFIDNSWIHGVTVTRTSEAGVMTWDAMNMTVEECAYIDPRGSISGGWRYGFCLDAQSTRVLFQRCYSDYGRHDFVTHARIPGPNVFVDCLSEHGLSLLGPHHRWATGTLFDNIKSNSTMAITEYATGSAGHAFCGAQTVGWNLECGAYICDAALGSQNYLIGSIGNEAHGAVSHDARPGSVFRGFWERSGPAGSHVAVRSLYLKQLEDRLGTSALDNITVPAQLSGNIYNMLSAWGGNGLFYSDNVGVTQVEVLPAIATVHIGNVKQLTAEVSPWDASNKSINWTSENPNIATVNASGLVAAISVGTVNIVATSVSGSIQASSAITVTSNPDYFYTTLQAENAQFNGAVIASNNAGYNGAGFIDFQNATGDFVNWTVNVPEAGNYTLAFRYALASGNRPLSLSINGTEVNAALNFAGTGSITSWNYITTTQNLIIGSNTIKITSNGSNGASIDEIIIAGSALAPVSVASISVTPSATSIKMHTTRQLTATVLPANAINKSVLWISSNTAVATISADGLIKGIGVGATTITATTHDGWKIATAEVNITPATVNKIISNCETVTGWTSANTLTLNTSDKKEGNASLQSAGNKTDEFSFLLSTPINTGATVEADKLQFWYFVSDVSMFSSVNQVELGSGGKADINEFSWNLGTLVNGWNLVSLPFKNAGVVGTPDLAAINWFRVYHVKTGTVTTKIDQIIIDTNTTPNAVSMIEKDVFKVYPSLYNKHALIIEIDPNEISGNTEISITNLHGIEIYNCNAMNNNKLEINSTLLKQNSIYLVTFKSAKFTVTKKVVIR